MADSKDKTEAPKKGPTAGMKVAEDDDGNLLLAGTDERVGIAPETGEVVSVTVETLMAAKGLTRAKAEAMYLKIAALDGGRYFFNPKTEPTSYRPPLIIEGLKPDVRERVDAILNSEV